jgi:hypothetical protein
MTSYSRWVEGVEDEAAERAHRGPGSADRLPAGQAGAQADGDAQALELLREQEQ